MAHMDIAERRLPQDGRIQLHTSNQDIDVRVSTIPTVNGESISLRLLSRTDQQFGFERLDLSEKQSRIIRNLLAQPNGIILVTGPTGCGKSTSLYCFLSSINSVQRRIITIEEPVEYRLPGVSQIDVKPEIDLTFAKRYSYPVQQGSYVLLTVSDSGIGMDATTQAHIFEPFFTTKEKGKGTGLGLATAYGIVKQSGGYIDVYSELGTGTTFKIYLPRVHDALDSQKAPENDLMKSRGNETILLAADETSLRTLTRNLLELSGYTVLEAKSGADAITISQQHSGPLQLLLTDVVMPGMSGRALAGQLTGQRPLIKVVYMSGYTGQAVGAHGALEEGSFFLQKPFSRDGLVSKVRLALDSGPAERPEEAPAVPYLNQKSGEPTCKES